MTEATAICQLAASLLRQHEDHPQYHRILLPGIQGVEAVLTILQDRYGFSHPGGLFLAAVDVMLEKQAVVQAVRQQLESCKESTAKITLKSWASASVLQQQASAADELTSSTADSSAAASSGSSNGDEQTRVQAARSDAAVALSLTSLARGSSPQESSELQQDQDQPSVNAQNTLVPPASGDSNATAAQPEHRVGSTGAAAHSTTSMQADLAPPGTSSSSSPQAHSTGCRASTAGAHADGQPLEPLQPTSSHEGSPAWQTPNKPVAPPAASTASPAVPGTTSKVRQQAREQQERLHQQQHQHLQALLFDAPSEVFSASLAGSLRHINLSAVNSPQQIQTQQELQQELSRSSWSSGRQTQQQWQQQAEQQQLLPLPQKAQEQQQLQDTLHFARQPVSFIQQQQQQQLGSPVSTWRQWQQRPVGSPGGSSPWQNMQQPMASPLAQPQPQHKQPPMTPPVALPHGPNGPDATPRSGPVQQRHQDATPETRMMQPSEQQQQASASLLPLPQHQPSHTAGLQAPLQPPPQQQQQQWLPDEQRHDLQHLAGILQPVLYDDAAASEVLSEWLSGSDVAVAESETGSERFMHPSYPSELGYVGHTPAGQVMPAAGFSSSHMPPTAPPHMQAFVPAAAGMNAAGWQLQASPSAGQADSRQAVRTPVTAARHHLQPAWPQSAPHGLGLHAGSTGDGAAASAAAATTAASGALAPATAVSAGSSSITVKQPAAVHQEDGQSLVLDIDLAKVLDSTGTIVLQVRRDESGNLTAEAALAPTGYPPGAAQGGSVLPAAATSPVISSRQQGSQLEVPFGSISVAGSIGAAASSSWQQGTSRSHGLQQQQDHDQGPDDLPVHRVLRYSAEGRISIGSLEALSSAAAAQSKRVQLRHEQPATASSVGSPISWGGVHNGSTYWGKLKGQQGEQDEGEQEDREHLAVAEGYGLKHAAPPRQLSDMSWVLADIQPTQLHCISPRQLVGVPQRTGAPTYDDEQQTPVEAPEQQEQQLQAAQRTRQHGGQEELHSELADTTAAGAAGPTAGAGHDRQPTHAVVDSKGDTTGHAAQQAGCDERAAADGRCCSPLGSTAAEAVTPAPAAPRVAGLAAPCQAHSPVPPELVPTETPAGFKFWGPGRAAAAAGGPGAGLRYPAAQDAMDSVNNLGRNSPGAAAQAGHARTDATAQGAEGATAEAAPVAVPTSQGQQQPWQLACDLLGQSLELLGLTDASLSQFGLHQVSLDLLTAGLKGHSLEQHMLQALQLGAVANAGGAGQQQQAGLERQLAGAQHLAATAVELIRQSLALAAAAQPTAASHTQQQEQGTQTLGSSAGGITDTRAYQSLELLPHQLLQSLQAASCSTPTSPHPSVQVPMAAAVLPLLLLSQQQRVLQTRADAAAGADGGSSSTSQQQCGQQQHSADDLTRWLSGRFGPSDQVHSSVNLLLQELEEQQQQPLAAATAHPMPKAHLRATNSLAAAAVMAAHGPQQVDGAHVVSGATCQQAGTDAGVLTAGCEAAAQRQSEALGVAGGAAAMHTPAALQLQPKSPTAATATATAPAAVEGDSDTVKSTAAAAAAALLHEECDVSELCATASPILSWQSAAHWGAAGAQQEQLPPHLQHASTEGQRRQAGSRYQHMPLQVQQQVPALQQGDEERYQSWTNKVQQLLQSHSPDIPADVPTVATSGSLGITPSPSGWVYSHSSSNIPAAADAAAAAVAANGNHDDMLLQISTLVQEPSGCRTSVMTNPLYWAEPSTADAGVDAFCHDVAATAAGQQAAAAGQQAVSPAREAAGGAKSLTALGCAPSSRDGVEGLDALSTATVVDPSSALIPDGDQNSALQPSVPAPLGATACGQEAVAVSPAVSADAASPRGGPECGEDLQHSLAASDKKSTLGLVDAYDIQPYTGTEAGTAATAGGQVDQLAKQEPPAPADVLLQYLPYSSSTSSCGGSSTRSSHCASVEPGPVSPSSAPQRSPASGSVGLQPHVSQDNLRAQGGAAGSPAEAEVDPTQPQWGQAMQDVGVTQQDVGVTAAAPESSSSTDGLCDGALVTTAMSSNDPVDAGAGSAAGAVGHQAGVGPTDAVIEQLPAAHGSHQMHTPAGTPTPAAEDMAQPPASSGASSTATTSLAAAGGSCQRPAALLAVAEPCSAHTMAVHTAASCPTSSRAAWSVAASPQGCLTSTPNTPQALLKVTQASQEELCHSLRQLAEQLEAQQGPHTAPLHAAAAARQADVTEAGQLGAVVDGGSCSAAAVDAAPTDDTAGACDGDVSLQAGPRACDGDVSLQSGPRSGAAPQLQLCSAVTVAPAAVSPVSCEDTGSAGGSSPQVLSCLQTPDQQNQPGQPPEQVQPVSDLPITCTTAVQGKSLEDKAQPLECEPSEQHQHFTGLQCQSSSFLDPQDMQQQQQGEPDEQPDQHQQPELPACASMDDGQQQEQQQGQGQQVPAAPGSISRIQLLMRKLRDRRRPRQAAPEVATDGTAAAMLAETELQRGCCPAADGMAPESSASSKADGSHNLEAPSTAAAALPSEAVPLQHTPDVSTARALVPAADAGAGDALEGAVDGDAIASLSPALQSQTSTAFEDTLLAAEAAMQKALERIKLLGQPEHHVGQLQQEQEQRQVVLPTVEPQEAQQVHVEQQQELQWVGDCHPATPSATAAGTNPVGEQQQQSCRLQQHSPAWHDAQGRHHTQEVQGQAPRAAGAVEHDAAVQLDPQQQQQQQQQQQVSTAAGSTSAQWVRELLQGSSRFSSYLRSMASAGGDVLPGSTASARGTAGTPAPAAAAPTALNSCNEGLRQQVASKMSSLLAVVSASDERYSSDNSSVSSDSSDSNQGLIRDVRGSAGVERSSRVEPAGAPTGSAAQGPAGAWQERIQVLLAAADAAAATLAQPPQQPLPQQQHQQGLQKQQQAESNAVAAAARLRRHNTKPISTHTRVHGTRGPGTSRAVGRTTARGKSLMATQPSASAAVAGIMAARHAKLSACAASAALGSAAELQKAAGAEVLPASDTQQRTRVQQSARATVEDTMPCVSAAAPAAAGCTSGLPHPAAAVASASGGPSTGSKDAAAATYGVDLQAEPTLPALLHQHSRHAQAVIAQQVAMLQHTKHSDGTRPILGQKLLQQDLAAHKLQQQPSGHQLPQQQRPKEHHLPQQACHKESSVVLPPTEMQNAAVLAARQRERLQQLSRQRTLQRQAQQQQQQQQVMGMVMATTQQSHSTATVPAASTSASGRREGDWSAKAPTPATADAFESVVSRHHNQHPERVSPESKASRGKRQATAGAGPAAQAAKLRPQCSKQADLLAGSSGAAGAGPATDAAVGAVPDQAQASKRAARAAVSIFDVPRPQGYTFSVAKARAAAELAGAECFAVVQRASGATAGSKQTSKPSAPAPPSDGAVAPTHLEQQCLTPSGARAVYCPNRARREDSRTGGAAGLIRAGGSSRVSTGGVKQSPHSSALFSVSPEASSSSLAGGADAGRESQGACDHNTQGGSGEQQCPMHKAELGAGCASLQQVWSSVLEPQDSAASTRSHGLSLRKGPRQQLSASAAAAAATQGDGQPLAQQQQQQQPADSSRGSMHSQTPGGEQQAMAPGLRLRQRSVVPAARQQGVHAVGAGSVGTQLGSTSAGTAAAVSAIKAALAGFGTRGWQQQDITSWLSRLRLDLLPDEQWQPLLTNPLRNGLLLAGIAAAVTLHRLPGIWQPVRTLSAARANLLSAACHLGLISGRFATRAAAAAAHWDKDATRSEASSGPSLNVQGLGPGGGSPGFKAQQTGMLHSSPVRGRVRGAGTPASSCGSSPLKSHHHSTHSLSPSRSCCHIQAAASQSGGVYGVALDPTCSCECFTQVAAGPNTHSLMCDGSDLGAPGLSSAIQGRASSCCCGCWACQQLDGSVLEHAVLQLLEWVLAGDVSCMWGLLYALQQAFPVVPTPKSPNKSPATATSSPTKQQQQQQKRLASAVHSSSKGSASQASSSNLTGSVREVLAGDAAGGGGAAGCVVVHPLQGPSWRSFQLPYSAGELQELEQHLLHWLVGLDIIDAAGSPDFSTISADLSSGVILAEVAAAVTAAPVVGVQERPVTAAARRGNIQAALDAIQALPHLQCKGLLQEHAAAVLAGERPALTALLEALWVLDTKQQGQPWLRWMQQQQQQQHRPAGGASGSSARTTAARVLKT